MCSTIRRTPPLFSTICMAVAPEAVFTFWTYAGTPRYYRLVPQIEPPAPNLFATATGSRRPLAIAGATLERTKVAGRGWRAVVDQMPITGRRPW